MRVFPDLSSIRVASPDPERAKSALVTIIACAGGQFVGKTKLHKVFWLAHLFHWQDENGILTTHPIARLPHGPGIHDGDHLLRELERSKQIEIDAGRNGPFPEYTYRLLVESPIDQTNPAHRSIQKAWAFFAPMTATQASDYAHEFSRSWRDGSSGQELDIYSDLLPDEEFDQIKQASAELEKMVREALG